MTRDEAFDAAAQILTDERAVRDSLPVGQAAERAFSPGGPSVEEIAAIIAAQRAAAARQQTAA